MRIVICDDEPEFAGDLKDMLQTEFAKYDVVCDFTVALSGEELLRICSIEKIDVVFLDLVMPDLDGYEAARRLRALMKNVMIIFVSNDTSAFCRTFLYDPVWFIPKADMEWISLAVEKVVKRYKEMKNTTAVLKDGGRDVSLELSDIKYFKTEGHYIRYANSDGTMSESRRLRMSDLEEQLRGHWFARSHSRYLVNLRSVQEIAEDRLILKGGDTVPVSRNRKSEVKDKFQDYLRSVR